MKYLILFLSLYLLFSSSFSQTNWTDYIDNPVLRWGNVEDWDGEAIWDPEVIKTDNGYVLYYLGYEVASNQNAIGIALSDDGITWTKYENNPVLLLGNNGDWDDWRLASGPVVFDGSEYKMWYQAFPAQGRLDGKVGLATSGLVWEKCSQNPVLDVGESDEWDSYFVGRGSVIFHESIYKMWYTGSNDGTSPHLGYATSEDGITWVKYEANPLAGFAESGQWDEQGVWNCSVIFNGTFFEMWYGSDGNIGYASSENGISWTQYEGNPIVSKNFGSAFFDNGIYRMWYYPNGESFGYLEDFSNIAHLDSIAINRTFVRPLIDTLLISAWINNPQGNALTVRTIMSAPHSDFIDSLDLNKSEDGLWKGSLVSNGEMVCNIGIKTIDQKTGSVHDSRLWTVNKFCSSGPVKLKDFQIVSTDTIPDAGDRLHFTFSVQNNGLTDTVYNIHSETTSLDSFCETIYFAPPEYGNIAPGETAEGHRPISIKFFEDCPATSHLFLQEFYSDGVLFWSDTFKVDVVTAIAEKENHLPKRFVLSQNFPNPFNPKTTIKYQLAELSQAKLTVYDLTGKEVATLVSEKQPAGSYKVEWDASKFGSGVYFYRLETDKGFIETKKLVLMK